MVAMAVCLTKIRYTLSSSSTASAVISPVELRRAGNHLDAAPMEWWILFSLYVLQPYKFDIVRRFRPI
jgi:hypothetical protein